MSNSHKQWQDFLNPSTLRHRMLTASLFLVAHEMLLDAVKTRLKDFFLFRFGAHELRYSPDYEEKILSLDPKGKKDQWRSSLVWLERMGAIDLKDLENIKKCTDARNLFAHELRKIISGQTKPDFEELFPLLIDLIIKIDKWWIINVEIETNPEFSHTEIVEDAVVPGSQLLLSIIYQSAVGDMKAAQELYDEFVRQTSGTI